MSEELVKEVCIPCREGGKSVSTEEANLWLETLPGWSIETLDGVSQLVRAFTFKNFRQAIAFTNQIGEIAEKEKHHPGIFTEWGKVTVFWWTHSINGLHKNDFVMAAKSSKLFDQL